MPAHLGYDMNPQDNFPSELDLKNKREKQEAKRDKKSFRYDLISSSFIYEMARIANYGAEHYGELNWCKSRLTGEKGPVNHIHNHLRLYQENELYDHSEIGEDKKFHLVAIAFNAMMEYWYECHPEVE